MKKVLVTGGTGFLGKALALRLKDHGYQVRAVGRNAATGAELKDLGIQFSPLDLTQEEAVKEVCKGQDFVFHCAAYSYPWGKWKDYYRCNVEGTNNIITACQAHDVGRLIHVSTPSLYFDYTNKLNIKESDPLPDTAVNAYAATKRIAEESIDLAAKKGLATITIRPRAIFGPGDTTILPRILRAGAANKLIKIRNIDPLIDITYIDNVIDALLLCMYSPDSTLGKKYNISNGEPIRLFEVLQELFKLVKQDYSPRQIPYTFAYWWATLSECLSNTILFGKEPSFTRYTVGLLSTSQTLDITAARQELKYHVNTSVSEGLEHFAKWWSEGHFDYCS